MRVARPAAVALLVLSVVACVIVLAVDLPVMDDAGTYVRTHEGAQAVRAAWELFFASTPTTTFTVEDAFGAGDRAVQRWRFDWGRGHVRGVDVFRVRDGRVAEKLSYVKG